MSQAKDLLRLRKSKLVVLNSEQLSLVAGGVTDVATGDMNQWVGNKLGPSEMNCGGDRVGGDSWGCTNRPELCVPPPPNDEE